MAGSSPARNPHVGVAACGRAQPLDHSRLVHGTRAGARLITCRRLPHATGRRVRLSYHPLRSHR
jgi:hypothetical protein